jgi:hypothetical protein
LRESSSSGSNKRFAGCGNRRRWKESKRTSLQRDLAGKRSDRPVISNVELLKRRMKQAPFTRLKRHRAVGVRVLASLLRADEPTCLVAFHFSDLALVASQLTITSNQKRSILRLAFAPIRLTSISKAQSPHAGARAPRTLAINPPTKVVIVQSAPIAAAGTLTHIINVSSHKKKK